MSKTITGKDLVGKKVEIVSRQSWFYNFWGYVRVYDGRWYHVSGGAIGKNHAPPVFLRRELRIMK